MGRQPLLFEELSMRFHITTLGCPKNTVDSEMMASLLQQAGHVLVASPKRADVHIINTCGFIADARDESYEALTQAAQRKRRNQLLVAAGCIRFGRASGNHGRYGLSQDRRWL